MIYDFDDMKSLFFMIIKEMNFDKSVYNFNMIWSCIFLVKSNLIILKFYVENEELKIQDCMVKMLLVYQIYVKYMVCCKWVGVMDFDDLLYCLYELL